MAMMTVHNHEAHSVADERDSRSAANDGVHVYAILTLLLSVKGYSDLRRTRVVS